MVSSSIVLEKLTSSFQTLPYPGDLNLVYDNTGYHLECVDIQQAFAGKHWSELSQETLIRESSALAFLTPEAFRFYLPAYLSNVVREFDESDALPEISVYYLTLPVEADSLINLSYIQQQSNETKLEVSQFLMEELSRSNQKVHRFMELMFGFNQQQGQAIRYYLEYLKAEKNDYFFSNEPEIAIERYWFIFPL
jgi:hypothetical protein